jgi:hypothetical protein
MNISTSKLEVTYIRLNRLLLSPRLKWGYSECPKKFTILNLWVEYLHSISNLWGTNSQVLGILLKSEKNKEKAME